MDWPSLGSGGDFCVPYHCPTCNQPSAAVNQAAAGGAEGWICFHTPSGHCIAGLAGSLPIAGPSTQYEAASFGDNCTDPSTNPVIVGEDD